MDIIQTAADDEREYAENMPESMQESEKHELAEETADNLEGVASDIEGVISSLEEAYV